MQILTKQQAAEIAYRPLLQSGNKEIIGRCVDKVSSIPDQNFIKMFRKSTGLMLCSFAPEKFYIRYN